MLFFFKKILTLTISFFVLQFVFFTFTKNILDSKSNFRITRYFNNPIHKNFIIGNSRGVNSINEFYAKNTLKLDVINLSYNGMPFEYNYALFQDINSHNHNSTIFIEITCLTNEGVDNSYVYYSDKSQFFKKKYPEIKYKVFPLLKLNNEFFLRNIYYLFKKDDDWINRNRINKNIINSISQNEVNHIISDKTKFIQNIYEYNRIAEINNNKIIYFLAPYYPKYLRTFVDYKDLRSFFLESKNIFIDLNTLKLNDNLFADRLHTNVEGSYILTKKLMGFNIDK